MSFRKGVAPLILLLVAYATTSSSVLAQAPIEPERLPANTMFYLLWRGAPSPSVRQGNALLSLWDDPELVLMRSAMIQNVVAESARDKSKAPTQEQIEQYAALLENAFLVGYYREPAEHRHPGRERKAAGKSKWNGFFLVYDRTGKENVLQSLLPRAQASAKQPSKITPVVLAGTAAVKVEGANDTSYWSETGKFAVGTGEPLVFEEIVGRLNGRPAASGGALGQAPAYKEARAQFASEDLLEFFLEIPRLEELLPQNVTSEPSTTRMLQAFRFDAVHSLAGSVSLDGTRTRLAGALLGDTSTGTIFDLWHEAGNTQTSAAFVPTQAISYSYSQLDLAGLYQWIGRATQSFSPSGPQGMDLVGSMVQQRIGMPLPDALALLTGEFASIQTSPALDTKGQVFVIGIRKREETLRLIRMLLSDRIASTRSEGDVVFFKLSTHGGESGAGTVQWGSYQMAVTNDAVILTSRSDTLRTLLAERAHPGATSAFMLQPRYQQARTHFPATISGMSFFDFQRVDWNAAKTAWLLEARKQVGKPGTSKNDRTLEQWLEQFHPEVISRHLHTSFGASWKDSSGLKFAGWIE